MARYQVIPTPTARHTDSERSDSIMSAKCLQSVRVSGIKRACVSACVWEFECLCVCESLKPACYIGCCFGWGLRSLSVSVKPKARVQGLIRGWSITHKCACWLVNVFRGFALLYGYVVSVYSISSCSWIWSGWQSTKWSFTILCNVN